MKRVLLAVVAIAILAVGGFVILTSAHADDGQGSCGTNNCGSPPPCTGPSCK